MLDKIFTSGEKGTIKAIKSNIEEFYEKIIEKDAAKKEKEESDAKIENLEKEVQKLKEEENPCTG